MARSPYNEIQMAFTKAKGRREARGPFLNNTLVPALCAFLECDRPKVDCQIHPPSGNGLPFTIALSVNGGSIPVSGSLRGIANAGFAITVADGAKITIKGETDAAAIAKWCEEMRGQLLALAEAGEGTLVAPPPVFY